MIDKVIGSYLSLFIDGYFFLFFGLSTKNKKRSNLCELCASAVKCLIERVAIFLARDFSGISCKALGKYFGRISGPAITLSYKHFTGKLRSDKGLLGKVKKRILII